MAATNLGAYLIIARYNRDEWNKLKAEEREEARAKAETLFPFNRNPQSNPAGAVAQSAAASMSEGEASQPASLPTGEAVPLPVSQTVPVPGVSGVRMMRSIHTGVHELLPDNISKLSDGEQDIILTRVFNDLKKEGQGSSVPDAHGPRKTKSGWNAELPANFEEMPAPERDRILTAIFRNSRDQHRRAADKHFTKDEGIGWVAIVDAGAFDLFVDQHMGGKSGPLWKMYDITLIPLNDDQTTGDIYEFMTPVHWNKV